MFLAQNQIEILQEASAEEGLNLLAQWVGDGIAFSSALGEEDQVITKLIASQNLNIRIFTLDTGRLFGETYELLEKTNARYKINIEVYFPQATLVEAYVKTKGINGFYESIENRKACCNIRKVDALNRALNETKIWVTGLRSDQSDNRHDMPKIEWLPDRKMYKYNPLLHWTYQDLTNYIQLHNVPINPLHKAGFVSIGCAPCTRAIEPGEDLRAGRWWWETSKKECGLHSEITIQT